MSRIYSSTNRIRFTDIPEKYAVPRMYRGKQSEMHSAVVTYVFDHYRDTKKYRQTVVDALNRLTYCVMQNEPPSFKWVSTDPLDTMPDIDIDLVEATLGDFYLTSDAIEWDVSPSQIFADTASESDSVQPSDTDDVAPKVVPVNKPKPVAHSSTVTNRLLHAAKQESRLEASGKTVPTPKEDLYIQPPHCLRFDVSKVWMSSKVGNDDLVIYTTLPEVPQCQNEISITTDLSLMTDSELMALYPNHVIHTRAAAMYEKYEGIEYDDDLGCIIPIEGFTKDQVVDNIIKYPHLYRLRKMSSDGKLQPFFSTIEIDGELKVTSEVWDTLPESKIVPRDSEFIKEYVIRRYLLERDSGVKHSYPMVASLDPFLTLFMPYTRYKERGYIDTLSIVKQCVTSRIHYKQSRSPILRRIEQNV